MEAFGRVWQELEAAGLLLESDAKLPSVVSLVTGAPVRGSWWSHPRGPAIFRVNGLLADHPDVVVAKLVSGKVTFVHRELWPALLRVATSGEPWQQRALSPAARTLLTKVNEAGLVRTDQLAASRHGNTRSWGDAARDLEARILVHSEQVHTETGKHAKCLERWDRWAKRVRCSGRGMTTEQARRRLEQVMSTLNARYGAMGRLPWF